MKLGTVACLHGSIGNARRLVSRFRKENVDAITLVGDIGADEKQKQSLVKIIKIFSKIKKKIFIMPGNHEQYAAYCSALKKFKSNKNIVDCSDIEAHQFGGRQLVFMPSSGLAGPPNSGFMLFPNRKLIKRLKKRMKDKFYKKHFAAMRKVLFMTDAMRLLDKNSIVITHSPIKFNTAGAIDVAVFGQPKRPFVLKIKHRRISVSTNPAEVMLPKRVIFTLDEAKKMIRVGCPVEIKKKNVGDERLKKLLRKKKISKFICGDIHEAGGRANDWRGRAIKQNKFSKELFFNCAAGKEGRAGIVEFLNEKAKYKVVRV